MRQRGRDIAPFPWDALGRTTAGLVRATAFASALFDRDFDHLSAGIRAVLSDLGVSLDRLELAAVATHRGSTFTLDVGDAVATNIRWPGVNTPGAIVVDRRLATAVLGALLDSSEPISGPIDDYDFGLFSFALLEIVAACSDAGLPPLVVDVERRPVRLVAESVAGPHPVHEFAFHLELASVTGWARLFLPGPIRTVLADRARRRPLDLDALQNTAAGKVALRLDLGLGRVPLSSPELQSLSPGDVVFLLDQALEAFEPTGSARLWLAPDAWIEGRLTQAERWKFAPTDLSPRTSEEPDMEKAAAQTEETTQMVQKASVSLEAVVGRVEISLDRLARLKPGEVLECDGPVGQPVDLVANGTTVASAELVDVEGRLGVRILSLTR